MKSWRSNMMVVSLCATALGCTPSGCPEGSEEVDGLCLPVDAGAGEDSIEGGGQAGGGHGGDGGAAGSDGAAGGAGAAGAPGDLPDAGVDGGPDAAEAPECDAERPCSDDLQCIDGACTFVPPERVPSSVLQSSGGGAGRSESFELRLAVGAPQPMGQGQSDQLRVRIGPAAAVQ